jgi:MFS family permease
MIANVAGIVVGGDMADRIGARRPMLMGIAIFTAGLVVAGSARSMLWFVVGRAVQGLGGGLVLVALYVVIAEAYPEALRPKMFAAISAAWVLPSLVGPVASGALTQHVSWRLVFLLIPPFVVLGLMLILPALRALPDRALPTESARWRYALVAAAGVAAMQYAGQQLRWISFLPLAAGLGLLIFGMRPLLPPGTIRARPGMPAVVALRGLIAGAYFAVEAYVPLTLSRLHNYGATEAGIPLTVGALGWAAGSWWQGSRSRLSRPAMIRLGAGLVVVAAGLMAVVTLPAPTGVVAYGAWLVGGAGMGLVMPSLSVLLLEYSPPAERGKNSSSLQICDVASGAITVGLGGALVAAAEHGVLSLRGAVGSVDLLMSVLAVGAAVVASRAGTRGRSAATAR